METVEREVKRFRHPFSCRVVGPSGCGKTLLVGKIIENFREILCFKEQTPEKFRVLWAYGIEGAVRPLQYPGVQITYVEGIPSMDEIKNNHLLIMDDLMSELSKDSQVGNLFTRGRHLDISTILLLQNAIPPGREMRNVSLNTCYLILFNNPSDNSQTQIIARRMYPRHHRWFLECFADATKKPYGYIRQDNTPETPNKYRLQTEIIPNNGVLNTTCYLRKNVD